MFILSQRIHVKYDTQLQISQFSTSLVQRLCLSVPLSLVSKSDHSSINKQQWWDCVWRTCAMKTIRTPKSSSKPLLQHQTLHKILIIYFTNNKHTLIKIVTGCSELLSTDQLRLHWTLTGYIFPLIICCFCGLRRRYSPRNGMIFGSTVPPDICASRSDWRPPHVKT